MENRRNDHGKMMNFLSPTTAVGFGQIRTQFSYSTLHLNNQIQTVSSLEYTKFTKSENNLDTNFSNEHHVPDISKLLREFSAQHQETTPPHDIEQNLNNFKSDRSIPDIKALKTKFSNVLKTIMSTIKTMGLQEQITNLDSIHHIMETTWKIPTYGHRLGQSLCHYLYSSGGLDMLIENCTETDTNLQFSSARLLEQCLTRRNINHCVYRGLEKVVKLAAAYANKCDTKYSRVGTGILEHLFKHCEKTCYDVIMLGGLDAVLFECRTNDLETLRNCARSLANLSLYGGAENQEAMISRKVPMWLFPLAFHRDDNIKYYACLTIAVLVANKEIEAEVLKSGTLKLVEPFVTSQDPSKFSKRILANVKGQSKEWLRRLVPVLSSNREEAIYLAAFHFCMEAVIKKEQGMTKIFREIDVIEPLKAVASSPNALASKLAAQTLRLIGENVPHKLSQQVPLWSIEDVQEWVKQVGFGGFEHQFVNSQVDGDMLLQLNELHLKEDIGMSNGILRMRFTRELNNLKKMADYSSKNCSEIHEFLNKIGPDYCVYTYDIFNAGIGAHQLELLNDYLLIKECNIHKSIHRHTIQDAAVCLKNSMSKQMEASKDSYDVFVSYRRSSGEQLASLLKVHLNLRGFKVFIDVERLEAGTYDCGLLNTIRKTKHFILVLSSNALEMCIDDHEGKDWLHREIVEALDSNCNIIPIVDNFNWPAIERLPEDMRSVCCFNTVNWIHDYQDACIDKLERFLVGDAKTDAVSSHTIDINHPNNNSSCLQSNKSKKAKYLERCHRKKSLNKDLRWISKEMANRYHYHDSLKRQFSLANSNINDSVGSINSSNSKSSYESSCVTLPPIIPLTSSKASNPKIEIVDFSDKFKQYNKSRSVDQLPNDNRLFVHGILNELAQSMQCLASHEDVRSQNGSSADSQFSTY